ncbi:hypothetical protein, partial [Crenothrix sp.]|uniref:hypothetical protein n=1 Tax=Crenothrix sp. TaxID=3100433 RepID=UPI00374D46B9
MSKFIIPSQSLGDCEPVGEGISELQLFFGSEATHLRRDTVQGLTVRPEPVEGWAVKPIMVRQA